MVCGRIFGTRASARLGRAGPAVGRERGKGRVGGSWHAGGDGKLGRKIAYGRLRVTDARGKELTARLQVASGMPAPATLAVVVNDAEAVYPVRIDPTFSDANWSSMGGIAGADNPVSATVVDGSGNLYIGGDFNVAGEVVANHVAKWNGSSWTALGSGMGGSFVLVCVLAVSGSDLYAGGFFTAAGGKVSAYTARAYLPPLPTLSVLRSSENVTVSWPAVDTGGFAFEQAGPLAAPAGWVTNSATVIDDGTNKSVTIPATHSSQFFRLRRP